MFRVSLKSIYGMKQKYYTETSLKLNLEIEHFQKDHSRINDLKCKTAIRLRISTQTSGGFYISHSFNSSNARTTRNNI